MRKNAIFFVAATLAAITFGCSDSKTDGQTSSNDSVITTLPGDSTIYGLACDGCNDTILVLLRDVTQNPDTFEILDASRNQLVFGHPRIGDQMAIVLENADTTASSAKPVARMVIDIDKILGSWCYMVTPKLRKRADIDKAMEQEFLKKMPDTTLQRLLQPREHGFMLKNDHQAQPIGMIRTGNTTDDRSPVEYPILKRYREWYLYNGHIILNETHRDSLGEQQLLSSDTADFVLLRRDSLILRFSDGERSYYRKSEETNAESNK